MTIYIPVFRMAVNMMEKYYGICGKHCALLSIENKKVFQQSQYFTEMTLKTL